MLIHLMTTLKNPVVHIANRAFAQVDKPLCTAGVFIMNNEEERWAVINGFNGYLISSFGRVKSLGRVVKRSNGTIKVKEKILVSVCDSRGYPMVCINGKSICVHRIVASTFLNHTFKSYDNVIDHIDNNKQNCRLDNLRIISQRLNCSKSKTHKKTSKYVGVSWSKLYNVWVSQFWDNSLKRNICLGRFKTEEEAHFAYQEKLKSFTK